MIRQLLVLIALFLAPAVAQAETCRWPQDSLTLVVDPSLDDVQGHGTAAVGAAVSAWTSEPVALPAVTVKVADADAVGYVPGLANKSTVRFAPSGHPLTKGALAVTVVTKSVSQGVILDADVIVNGDYHFRLLDLEDDSQSDGPIVYDLQNTLTHELGHVFGLGEDYDHTEATMYAYTKPRETKKRVLSADDLDSISRVYAAVAESDAGGASCGVAGGPSGGSPWIAIVATAAGVALLRRRRWRWALVAGSFALAFALPGHAEATPVWETARITSVSAHWEGGLIVSELSWRGDECDETCPEGATLVLGGRVGDIVQVVGHVPTPEAGARVRVTRTNGQTALAPVLERTTNEGTR